jgi:Raf kinase inhibitor-like YbhB/YbcL family protein
MRTLLALTTLSLALFDPALAAEFQLSSPNLKPSAPVPERHILNGFGCTGANVSPELIWSGSPEGTKSFALTVYDPDAPTGSGWWHWVVFNLPSSAEGLPEGAGDPARNLMVSRAVQGMTDFGRPGYGGPCPPVSDKPHHYVFTLHALKVDTIPLDDRAPAAMVGFVLGQNTIAKTSFTITYGR